MLSMKRQTTLIVKLKQIKKKFDIRKTLFISFGCRYIFKKETIQIFLVET